MQKYFVNLHSCSLWSAILLTLFFHGSDAQISHRSASPISIRYCTAILPSNAAQNKHKINSQGGYKNREKLKMQNAFLLSEQNITLEDDVVVCGVVRGVARNRAILLEIRLRTFLQRTTYLILPHAVAVSNGIYLMATRRVMHLQFPTGRNRLTGQLCVPGGTKYKSTMWPRADTKHGRKVCSHV